MGKREKGLAGFMAMASHSLQLCPKGGLVRGENEDRGVNGEKGKDGVERRGAKGKGSK